MELYNQVLKVADANFTYCSIPMILTLWFLHARFKNRFQTSRLLSILCWVIIIYTVVNLLHLIVSLIFFSNENPFTERFSGPYGLVYGLILMGAVVFPFTLLIKRLRGKFWYVLLVAFLLKSGAYFERYVIWTTSLYHDYAVEDGFGNFSLWMILLTPIVKGIVLAFAGLGLLALFDRRKMRVDKDVEIS